MKKAVRAFLGAGIAALFIAPWTFAQTSVSLTSAGGDVYDGIYVSPYYATVNGAPNTPIVCDDFADESKLPSNWNATVVAFSAISPTNTSWGLEGGILAQYNAVAYLTLQILHQMPGSTGQAINTFADWAVFDPSGVAGYLTSHPLTSGVLTTAALTFSGRRVAAVAGPCPMAVCSPLRTTPAFLAGDTT